MNELHIECATCNDTGRVLTEYGKQVRAVLLGDVQRLIDKAYKEVGMAIEEEEDTDVFLPAT